MSAFDRIEVSHPDLQRRAATAWEWQQRVMKGAVTIREMQALEQAIQKVLAVERKGA